MFDKKSTDYELNINTTAYRFFENITFKENMTFTERRAV